MEGDTHINFYLSNLERKKRERKREREGGREGERGEDKE